MNPNLRKVWTEVITADDLDLHLKNVGQAETNAHLVARLFAAAEPPKNSKVLFVGAGTGQMFDYLGSGVFTSHHLTFTDLNPAYLQRLEQRLRTFKERLRFRAVLDDIENTKLEGSFAAAVVVLVLEHIDWKRGLDAIAALHITELFLIIQRNDSAAPPVNPARALPPSIRAASELASSALIDERELAAYLEQAGYHPVTRLERAVPDQKTMLGLVFRKERKQAGNPLHGLTLEMILTKLVELYGWEELGERIDIKCFTTNPSIKSSLTFLRRTPWAREKVEKLYLKATQS